MSIHYGIGVPSALLAAAAGGTALSEGSVDARVIAAFALSATLLSALNTFLNPNEKAGQHHRTGVEYGRTRRKVRQFVQIASLLDTPEALRARLAELTDEVGRLQAEAPPLFKLAHWMAGRQIAGGSANYTADELAAAAGASPLGTH